MNFNLPNDLEIASKALILINIISTVCLIIIIYYENYFGQNKGTFCLIENINFKSKIKL